MKINVKKNGSIIFAVIVLVVTTMLPVDLYGQANVVAPGDEINKALPSPGNVSVNFKDVDIKTVLHYLSEVSGVDIIPSPGVDGVVTMRLRDKPWVVALDIVTRNYGYVYSSDEEAGIIRVIPKDVLQTEEPITVVIPLNYIIQDRELVEREKELAVSERTDNITKLLESVRAILAPAGEKATYSADSNSIIVTAIPSRVGTVREMLSKIDIETPQIMLEAKIIEITLDRNDQFGVDWNAVITAAGARRPITFPFGPNGQLPFLRGGGQGDYYPQTAIEVVGDTGNTLTSSTMFPSIDGNITPDPTSVQTDSSIFSYGTLDFSQFQATLELLDERDDTNIISSPRITTLNNQTASIKVVTNVFLQKSLAATDTANVVSVSFEDEPREVGVILEVTPHVNDKDEIMVNLAPQVSSNPIFSELAMEDGANTTVAMQYNSREADTQVLVKDGQTIFIGGLITETTTKENHKLPLLGDLLGWIPVLGGAVKYEKDNIDKTEVVFFVTVHLIKNPSNTISAAGPVVRRQYDKHYGQKEEEKKTAFAVKKGKVKVTDKKEAVYGQVAPEKSSDKKRKP
ncbi:MAG: hypothetical protein P9L90_01060, partial [Candidatus Aadella gelida]|nr:hypothetical protein [Candidatus Aadella gelida]